MSDIKIFEIQAGTFPFLVNIKASPHVGAGSNFRGIPARGYPPKTFLTCFKRFRSLQARDIFVKMWARSGKYEGKNDCRKSSKGINDDGPQ
jgi:hypothetical protein